VPASSLTVHNGIVSHARLVAGPRSATWLRWRRSRYPLVALKDPKDWTLIGRRPPRRFRRQDRRLGPLHDRRLPPDMLTAVIARPPLFGATVKSVDKTAPLRRA
jgi:isoquinoline 1-oxidoreductase beta subunit